MAAIQDWIRAFFPSIVGDSGQVYPPRGKLKIIGATFDDEPENDMITMSIIGGDTTVDGDVQGTLAESFVTALSGATPGSSEITIPAGNILRMSPAGLNSDTNAVLDLSYPGYICLGANDGSGTDNLQMLGTCDQVIVGTLKTGSGAAVSYLGESQFFGIGIEDANQPLVITIGSSLNILARSGTIATSLNIGWLNASTTGSGHFSKYFGQDGMQSGDDCDGGPVYFFGGKKHGTTGLKKGVFFAINGDPQNASGETMIETGEVIAGQRYVALCRGAVMTSTQMPANTGDLVTFIGNAAVIPTANAVGGGILYPQNGALKWRGSSGTITTMGTAEPHCDVCGADFMTEHESEKYGYLAVCLKCMADELGARKWIKRCKS